MRDIDGKRLMNDVRQGMGLDLVKEQYKINTDTLREQYFNKEIFNIGDIVESNNQPFEILDRGSNYLVVVDSNGETSRKWIQDVIMSEQTMFTDAQFRPELDEIPSQVSFKGYTTKHLDRASGAAKAFLETIRNMGDKDPVAVLTALKSTDEYLSITAEDVLEGGQENAEDLTKWNAAHLKAKRMLEHMGEFAFHAQYWHIYKDQLDKAVYAVRIVNNTKDDQGPLAEAAIVDPHKDKLKVARMIASILGVDDPEKSSNPENLVNTALRKTKSLNKDSLKIVSKMLKLATEVGINYDLKYAKNMKLTEEQQQLAMDRAQRYGRRYPNPIDNAWVLGEGKAPSIVADKNKVGNMASLRPDDEKKLIAERAEKEKAWKDGDLDQVTEVDEEIKIGRAHV